VTNRVTEGEEKERKESKREERRKKEMKRGDSWRERGAVSS